MLNSLKDMYICHPFMPIANIPEWYSHVKDIRCVVELDAANPISKYKNGNYIRAWLVVFAETVGNVVVKKMNIRIQCSQMLPVRQFGNRATESYIYLNDVNVYIWTNGAPATQSYILVDDVFTKDNVPYGEYELQPDCLIFMQKAPKLSMDAVVMGETINAQPGFNVSVSDSNDGILFYGAAGVGKGHYEDDPINALQNYQKGLGAKSLNGMDGNIWIKGSFPVNVKMTTPFDIEVSHELVEETT